MANTNKREIKIVDGKAVIIEMRESTLGREELAGERGRLIQRQQQLVRQMQNLKIEYTSIQTAIDEIDATYEKLPSGME